MRANQMSSFRAVRSAAVLALAAATLTGCLDTTGTGAEEGEPEIAGVIVEAVDGGAASGRTTITEGGGQAGALTLQGGAANALTIHVLGVDARDEPVVAEHHAEFEIQFRQNGVPLTSTMGTGYPFSFSVQPSGTGQQAYQLVIIHADHGEEEEFPILVTVQAASGT